MINMEHDEDIEGLRDDDPSEAFEAAKRIIQYPFPVDPIVCERLLEVALNKEEKLWARVAAVYTLGFVDDEAVTESRLRPLLEDPDSPPELLDYLDECLSEHMHLCAGYDMDDDILEDEEELSLS